MMLLNEDEVRTVRAVFFELLCKPYKELNTYLGSITIKEMQTLYSKMRYHGWCDKHDISYEDMTEEDYLSAEEDRLNEGTSWYSEEIDEETGIPEITYYGVPSKLHIGRMNYIRKKSPQA